MRSFPRAQSKHCDAAFSAQAAKAHNCPQPCLQGAVPGQLWPWLPEIGLETTSTPPHQSRCGAQREPTGMCMHTLGPGQPPPQPQTLGTEELVGPLRPPVPDRGLQTEDLGPCVPQERWPMALLSHTHPQLQAPGGPRCTKQGGSPRPVQPRAHQLASPWLEPG